MSSALIAPGVVLGRYPEREESEQGRVEQLLERFSQRLNRRALFRTGRLYRFAERVNRLAGEAALHSDQALRETARQSAARLRREGLSEQGVASLFALIREMSGRVLGMRHYDAQLMGGWVMLNGLLAEMDTGEGKTLAATLPAAAMALAGVPVHIVTVNDYLATRDAASMGPLYAALGLSVGSLVESDTPAQRRAAYACDITYCSNKQIVFDYLRDLVLTGDRPGRLSLELDSLCAAETGRERLLLMRGLSFAIVDEADSVLIDEARTPLILSRERSAEQSDGHYAQAVAVARRLREGEDFRVDRKGREIALRDSGRQRIAFITEPLGVFWSGRRRRELLLSQALSALHLFQPDRHYLVRDGKVQIIDEYTGRIMQDRSWEQGLHQMIEVKEGCRITGQRETLARISYQRFFRRYLSLGGTTGTARETAGELHRVYGLQVVPIPTHRPVLRRSLGERSFRTSAARWRAVVERAQTLRAEGRPVRVGTCSVADSELLSGLLTRSGLPHQVLNARQDKGEAEIVARAGEAGCITVATNMAGRGTDIALGSDVAQAGGLHVIATQRNEARRIDRQLFGRCGRQGDPGSYESLVSFEDGLIADFYGPRASASLSRLLGREIFPLPLLARCAMRIPQWALERRHRAMRKVFQQMDDHLERLLSLSGQKR